jgi:hypothetical protein
MIFFSLFSGLVHENNLKPYLKFRNDEELLKNPCEKFVEAVYEIEVFLRNPKEFSGIFGSS